MTDMICRKTMQRCATPSMCAPYGGCGDPIRAEIEELRRRIVALESLESLVNLVHVGIKP